MDIFGVIDGISIRRSVLPIKSLT